jgi:DNA-binding GntR family transcriptional regulator
MKLEPTNVSEEAYLRIKRMIIEGRLPAGEYIDRKALAEELGVSLTPVNEVLARLGGERFVERRGGGERKEPMGFYVRTLPGDELAHLFAVRAGLEGIAARLCVERALQEGPSPGYRELCRRFAGFAPPFDAASTEAYLEEDMHFHEGIIHESGNPVLVDIDGNLGCVHRSWIRGLVRPPEETLPEHRAIIEAFAAMDAEKAQGLIVLHNLRSRDTLQKTQDALIP